MNTAYTAYAEESDFRPDVQKKVSRPGFIDRWLFKKLQNSTAFEQIQQNEKKIMKLNSGSLVVDRGSPSIDQPERAIQFTVYNANGGRVIETRRYDRKTERHTNGLYIVTSEQDFGKEIDKIITMEHLKS
jgi:hypothetical protein